MTYRDNPQDKSYGAPRMNTLRAFTIKRRSWAMTLVALALLVRALVPAGYMVAPSTLTLNIQLCSDVQGEHASMQIVVPRSGNGQDGSGKPGQKNQPCAFSALGMASLAGADDLLLAQALAFILNTGAVYVASLACRPFAHQRPPLRGPPSLA